MLPRALRGCHLHHHDQKADSLLFLQPDRALRSHLIDGAPRIHIATWLWGEINIRSVDSVITVALVKLLGNERFYSRDLFSDSFSIRGEFTANVYAIRVSLLRAVMLNYEHLLHLQQWTKDRVLFPCNSSRPKASHYDRT